MSPQSALPASSLSPQLPSIPDSFSFHITVHVRTSQVSLFFSYFTPLFERLTKEPELLYFEIFQSSDDDESDPEGTTAISWVENWGKSTEWFYETHFAEEWFTEFLAKTEPLFVKPKEAKILRRLRGQYVVQKAGNLE